MSNEATVRSSLQIRKGNLNYQSQPTSFLANVSQAQPIGPVPGGFIATSLGVDVDLSKLQTKGGFAKIGVNGDSSYVGFAVVGVKDLTTGYFYPLMDVYPGENYIIRISKFMGGEEIGTGTFVSSHTTTLHVKAEGQLSMVCTCEAFDL